MSSDYKPDWTRTQDVFVCKAVADLRIPSDESRRKTIGDYPFVLECSSGPMFYNANGEAIPTGFEDAEWNLIRQYDPTAKDDVMQQLTAETERLGLYPKQEPKRGEVRRYIPQLVRSSYDTLGFYNEPYYKMTHDYPGGDCVPYADHAAKVAELGRELHTMRGEWSTLMADIQDYYADEKADHGNGRVRLVFSLLSNLRIERDDLKSQLAEAKAAGVARLAKAEELERQWLDTHAACMDESCDDVEKHCTCVGTLRESIRRLESQLVAERAKRERLREAIEEYIYMTADNGPRVTVLRKALADDAGGGE